MQIAKRTIEIDVLEDGNLSYALPLQRVGPSTWAAVHDSNYGIDVVTKKPLRQQTFPEASRLAIHSLQNKGEANVQPVVEAINRYVLTGNTLALWTPQGLYGVDCPSKELVAQLGRDEQNALVDIQRGLDKRLSGAKGKLVQTSEDRQVRFTGHENIVYDVQNREIFANNSGLVVLSGDEKTTQGLSEASNAYRLNPGFWGIGKQDKLVVKVPVLSSIGFGDGLDVAGRYAGLDDWCSFGVFDPGEASAQKSK